MFSFIKNRKEKSRKKQVYKAIISNNIKLLKELLNDGADPDYCINDNGFDVLSSKLAIDYDRVEALKLIMLHGGCLSDKCYNGITDALTYALISNSINCALYITSLDLKQEHNYENSGGNNIITAAVYTENLELVEKVINKVSHNEVEFKKLLNNETRVRPIYAAYSICRPDIVNLLISKGASPKLSNNKVLEYLAIAIENGSYEICKIILENHKHIFKEPKDSRYSSKAMDYPLITACSGSFTNEEDQLKIVNLLIDYGEGPNSEELFGKDPLIHAILAGNKKVAKLLIDRGANLNGTISRHPLLSAVACNDFDTVSLILEKAGEDLICSKKIGFMLVSILLEYIKNSYIVTDNVSNSLRTLIYSINKNINANAIINNIKLGEVKSLKVSDISNR